MTATVEQVPTYPLALQVGLNVSPFPTHSHSGLRAATAMQLNRLIAWRAVALMARGLAAVSATQALATASQTRWDGIVARLPHPSLCQHPQRHPPARARGHLVRRVGTVAGLGVADPLALMLAAR